MPTSFSLITLGKTESLFGAFPVLNNCVFSTSKIIEAAIQHAEVIITLQLCTGRKCSIIDLGIEVSKVYCSIHPQIELSVLLSADDMKLYPLR